jgi:hypothetical protein
MKGHHLSFPTKKFKIGSHENNLFFYFLFINFLLRTTPFWKFSNYVNSIDSSLKSYLEKILNLRLHGCNLCTPHICKCNAKVDEIGIHGLSCSKSSVDFQDTLKLILLSTGL